MHQNDRDPQASTATNCFERFATALKNLSGAKARSEKISALLTALTTDDLQKLYFDWRLWARQDQLPPPQDWTSWLLLGGRGSGKTRAGAEFIRSFAARFSGARLALIGETHSDTRDVMIEGVSGMLPIHALDERPVFEKTRGRLLWPNGTQAQLFSADEPDSLRGPEFNAAWCDEIAKWRYLDAAWDNLQFALRLGERPQQVITTTPRPVPLLKKLLADPHCVVSRAKTYDNSDNLPDAFFDSVIARYENTRLGRQELNGEMIEERDDALWSRSMIETSRVGATPDLQRVVIALDPAASSSKKADACGIVAAGKGADGHAYVIEDATLQGVRPDMWAAKAIALYHRHQADALIAEVNQGGEMIEAVVHAIDPSVPVTPVRASRGKYLRAEPVATLYARGRVHHAGQFAALEDEMCDFAAGGLSNGRSPDRVDALVWAITALQLDAAGPMVRRL